MSKKKTTIETKEVDVEIVPSGTQLPNSNPANTAIAQKENQALAMPFGIDPNDFKDLAMNLKEVDASAIPIIKMAKGGALFFQVENPFSEKGEEAVPQITGTVLAVKDTRGFYVTSLIPGYNGTTKGKRPDCFSTNGEIGVFNSEEWNNIIRTTLKDTRINDSEQVKLDSRLYKPTPSGICQDCIYARYDQKLMKAPCRPFKLIYLLEEGKLLPTLIRLPFGSIKIWSAYNAALIQHRTALNKCKTIFSLSKQTNQAGQEFSQIVLKPERKLEDYEIVFIKTYTEQIGALLERHANTIDITAEEATE